jgi:hypothetical protein
MLFLRFPSGHKILNGQKKIELEKGQITEVKMSVQYMSFSAHADAKGEWGEQSFLLNYLDICLSVADHNPHYYCPLDPDPAVAMRIQIQLLGKIVPYRQRQGVHMY